MSHRSLILSFLILFFNLTTSLAQGVGGKWEGTVEVSTKKKNVNQSFQFEFQLEEFGEIVKGTSRISTVSKTGEPPKYATMEVSGSFRNNVFTFKEIKVLSQEGFADPLQWCLKTGSLDLIVQQETSQLVGRWEGKNGSGQCMPGTINVVKVQ